MEELDSELDKLSGREPRLEHIGRVREKFLRPVTEGFGTNRGNKDGSLGRRRDVFRGFGGRWMNWRLGSLAVTAIAVAVNLV